MPDFIATKAKAFVGAALAGVATATAALNQACSSGKTGLAAVGAALVAFGAIYGVKNREA